MSDEPYVAPDWTPEQKATAAAREALRCWCGGKVGPRQPGDSAGLGCLENVTHWWTGQPHPQLWVSPHQQDAETLKRLLDTPTTEYAGLQIGARIEVWWGPRSYPAKVISTCAYGALAEISWSHEGGEASRLYVTRFADGAWT